MPTVAGIFRRSETAVFDSEAYSDFEVDSGALPIEGHQEPGQELWHAERAKSFERPYSEARNSSTYIAQSLSFTKYLVMINQ